MSAPFLSVAERAEVLQLSRTRVYQLLLRASHAWRSENSRLPDGRFPGVRASATGRRLSLVDLVTARD